MIMINKIWLINIQDIFVHKNAHVVIDYVELMTHHINFINVYLDIKSEDVQDLHSQMGKRQ